MPPKSEPLVSVHPKCEVHSDRLDRLESGQRELVDAINGTLQAPGLRTELAMLRQSTDRLKDQVEVVAETLADAARDERSRREPATRASIQVALLGALLSLVVGVSTGIVVWAATSATPKAAAHQH